MKKNHSQITVLHDSKEWNTRIEGEIGEIKVDGKKLNDVHDLTLKIDRMTTFIKALAVMATFLAIIASSLGVYVGSWLASNKEQISNHMDTTNAAGQGVLRRINLLQSSNIAYAKKLTELGVTWKDGTWQQIVNKD